MHTQTRLPLLHTALKRVNQSPHILFTNLQRAREVTF